MSRKSHKSKEIGAVLRELEALGWTVALRSGRGHAWGLIRCPNNDPDCRCGEFCQMGVWSTPQNPGRFARQLRSRALGCIRLSDTNEDPQEDE